MLFLFSLSCFFCYNRIWNILWLFCCVAYVLYSSFSIPISSITWYFVVDYRLSSVFLLGSLLGFWLCVGLLFNFTSSLYFGGKWRINILHFEVHLLLNCFRENLVFHFFFSFLKPNDSIHILNVGNALYDYFDFGPLLI